jgi:hypothetical protein
MPKPLLYALLIAQFGGRGRRPLRTALARVSVMTVLLGALGTLLAVSIWRTPLPNAVPALWLAAVVYGAAMGLGGMVLLAMAGTHGSRFGRQTIERLAATWPLSRSARWRVSVVPHLLVLVLIASFCFPLTVAIAHSFSAQPLLLVAALGGGLLAGLGWAVAPWPANLSMRVGLFAGAVAGYSWVLERALLSAVTGIAGASGISMVIGCTATLLVLRQSYRAAGSVARAASNQSVLVSPPGRHVYDLWYGIKLLRNRRTRGALVFGGVIVASTAAGVFIRQVGADIGWLLFGGIITASYACDVRGIVAHHHPPEIVMVRGVLFFIRCAWQTALTGGLLLGLPLVIVVGLQSVEPWPVLGPLYIAMQCFAVAAGLLAGSMFLPRDGDIGTQFFAVASASLLLCLIPWLARFSEVSLGVQVLVWSVGTCACLAVCYEIERIRSRAYGAI